MIWRGWTDLGGAVRGTPSIAGWTSRSLLIAVRGQNEHAMLGWRDENGWGGVWQDLGISGTDAPAVTKAAESNCVFLRRADNHLWVAGSMEAQDLGGDIYSAPSVAQWRMDRYAHVFARRADNGVWHVVWSPNGVRWESIGGQIDDAPSAVAWGPNRIDVVARVFQANRLQHCWWDGVTWSGWQTLMDGWALGSPCLVTRDIGQLELYYTDDMAQLVVRKFIGNAWSAPVRVAQSTEFNLTAFSFGPQHVEVLHTTAAGALERLYGEGTRAGDDPANAPNAPGGKFVSPPGSAASAATTIHCVARGSNGNVQHIVYDDGFWGNWENLGGLPIVGDPVAVSPSAGVLDIAVQAASNSVFRRRWSNGGWGSWIDTAAQTTDPIATLAWNNETRFLIRETDARLWEAAISADGTWRPWSNLGGTLRSRPHIAQVPFDVLPDPAGGGDFAVPAATFVCSLGEDGRTFARQLINGNWAAWFPFWDGNAQIARPLFVTWNLGLSSEENSLAGPPGDVSQAGWFGRTEDGLMKASASWWWQVGTLYGITTMPWTEVPPVPPDDLTDPVGLIMLEPLDNGTDPIVPTTWAFARSSDKTFKFTARQGLAPASPLGWQLFAPFGADESLAERHQADGDPALLILWERYEDAPLFHVVLVGSDLTLHASRGGTNPEPSRIRPQRSTPPAGRLWPRPRLVRP